MGWHIEEEAKRFVESKRIQFLGGLADGADDLAQYIEDNVHQSDEREYALKALQEAVLWCRWSVEKHGIK
jgi:hypothetical protein